MNGHQNMSETYRNEFEKRNNGQRLNNPALDWQKVTDEVDALNNRNAGRGYAAYGQHRIFENGTHEQAMAWVIKTVQWQ